MKMRSEASLRLTLEQKTYRDEDTDCLVWTGSISKAGQMRVNLTTAPGGGSTNVPRLTWTFKNGKIPEGHIVARRETCTNPRCVEPAHFELMEGERGNVAATAAIIRESDMPAYEDVIGTIQARKTHCKNGHEYTPENTAVSRRPDGGGYRRECRACRKKYQHDYRNRQAAKKTAAARLKAA